MGAAKDEHLSVARRRLLLDLILWWLQAYSFYKHILTILLVIFCFIRFHVVLMILAILIISLRASISLISQLNVLVLLSSTNVRYNVILIRYNVRRGHVDKHLY